MNCKIFGLMASGMASVFLTVAAMAFAFWAGWKIGVALFLWWLACNVDKEGREQMAECIKMAREVVEKIKEGK